MNLKQKLARLGPLRPAGTVTEAPDASNATPPNGVVGTATVTSTPAPISAPPAYAWRQAQSELFARAVRPEERIRQGLAALPRAKAQQAPPQTALPVEAVETSAGTLQLRLLARSEDERHGHVRLADAAGVSSETVARLALDPQLSEVDFEGALYLDLETTGLAGGTGTLPVVVGLAWFEGGAFQMEQLFLRRPGEERPLLTRVAERLAAAKALVTYNGKTFDWPLLRNRFVMNRLKTPAPPAHLDLLHSARRVFRWRGAGTRLADVERDVIGHRRVGDVPGAEIPERYFRYLRTGNSAPLLPVFEHNVSDVRLMAALLAYLCQRYEAREPQGDLRDHVGLGHVAFRNGELDRAARFGAAASGSTDPEISTEGLLLVARSALRSNDPATAAANLERALGRSRLSDRPPLHLALTKIYEHRLRDFGAALRHAALTGSAEREADRGRRLERLHRRADRTRPA